jgi:uncharacterized membrane protein
MTAPAPTPEHPFDSQAFNALAHFYRGEVGRIMIWRQRLDVTTNWAVGVTTALITGGYAQFANNHFIFVLAYFILFLLLSIEARRFRHYHAYLYRVRMMERHFIAALLKGERPADSDIGWREELAADLDKPEFKISKNHAIFSRFRKTYYWLYLLLTISWFTKVAEDSPQHTLQGFVSNFFAMQPFSFTLTCALLVIVFGTLIWLVIGGFWLIPYSEEFETPTTYSTRGPF